PIASWLTAAEPENPGQDPVARRERGMPFRRPDFARPAPTAQHRTLRQTLADLRPHVMKAARRAAAAQPLTRSVERGGNRHAQAQHAVSEAIQALIGERDMQEVESRHGMTARKQAASLA